MKYHFKIHEEEEGFWAQCLELEGCVTQANSQKELFINMVKALNLYLEEPEDSKEIISYPNEKTRKGKNIIQVSVDPQIAFAFMVRQNRLRHGLTQSQAAKKMGYKAIYNYQRLERKCNPNLETMSKIKEIYPEFSVDLALGCANK